MSILYQIYKLLPIQKILKSNYVEVFYLNSQSNTTYNIKLKCSVTYFQNRRRKLSHQ